MLDSALDALFTVNKLAKQYSETATEAYEHGFGADAKYKSVRKDALYGFKSYVLKQLHDNDNIDDISKHTINGKQYYCFYIGEYSFHSPIDDFDEDFPVSEEEDISDEFDSDPNYGELPLSEREAIEILDERFSRSPNDFLTRKFLVDYHTPRFIGWNYASGSVEIGDKIDEEVIINEKHSEKFFFEVGDKFETREGKLEICERYGIWSDGYHQYSDYVSKKPAYTIKLDGITEEKVLQERILDDLTCAG